jgi:predicted TIM-barrel fold metal-dependent hydrolase
MKRNLFKPLFLMAVLAVTLSCSEKIKYYSAGDFEKVPKTDSHFHYLTMDGRYMEFASSVNFRLLTPVWDGEEVSIDDQIRAAVSVYKSNIGSYAFFGAFPVDSFNFPGFTERTIKSIRRCVNEGAAGIKIWKNIGMVLKDNNGKYVMIDDTAFEPVFKYLEENNIPVIGHLGEPKDCWLPLDKMTDPSDIIYYKNNPQYYMYMHPEVPSYEKQIEARDNILRKYPHLDFTGAHLGSIEWSVDELSKRLDEYPNFRVDLAARMFHLQHQSSADYNKIRNFMIKYQDRILYGTDSEVHDIEGVTHSQAYEGLRNGWLRQWIYLATDSVINNIQGLKLPAEVIDKIYFKNADRYFNIKKDLLK